MTCLANSCQDPRATSSFVSYLLDVAIMRQNNPITAVPVDIFASFKLSLFLGISMRELEERRMSSPRTPLNRILIPQDDRNDIARIKRHVELGSKEYLDFFGDLVQYDSDLINLLVNISLI